MWPPISSLRISSAWDFASAGSSANLTPPAFMRPPVNTCDLITVGPSILSAACFASAAVLQKPYSVTGIPVRSTIRRRSYSKKRIGGGKSRGWRLSPCADSFGGADERSEREEKDPAGRPRGSPGGLRDCRGPDRGRGQGQEEGELCAAHLLQRPGEPGRPRRPRVECRGRPSAPACRCRQ